MNGLMERKPHKISSIRWMVFALLQALVPVLLLGAYIAFASDAWLHLFSDNEFKRQRARLERQVTIARGAIEPTLKEIREGKLSKREGLEKVRTILRSMTYKDEYGPNYYFLVSDMGVGLVHPYEPQKEDKYVLDEQDINGKYLFREILDMSLTNPEGGVVSYMYLPPGGKTPQEKKSFVINVPEINAVLGTGIYLDKFYQNQAQLFSEIRWTLLGLLALIGLASIASLMQAFRKNRLLIQEMQERARAQEEVRLSEENLRGVFDHMQDALLIHDMNGKIIKINQSATELYGVSENEAMKYNIHDLARPMEEETGSLLPIWQDVLDGKDVVIEGLTVRPHNGERIPIEVAMNPILWYGKKLILAVVRDVRERKAVERIIAESERKYRLLTENMQDVIFQMTKDLVFTYVSPSDERLRGYKAEEVIGRPIWDFLTPEMISHVRSQKEMFYNLLHEQDGSIAFEVEMIRKGGGTLWVEVVPTPVFDENGTFFGYQGMTRDISERRRADERLRHSEERFRAVAEKLSEGLVVVDQTGKVVEWNDAFTEMTQIPETEALGQNLWDMQIRMLKPEARSPERLEEMQRFTQLLLEGKGEEYLNHPVVLKDLFFSGKSRILEETVFRFSTSEGIHVATLIRDITEQENAREKIEYELRKLESLRDIDARIIDQSPIEESMQVVIRQVVEHLHADGAQILLFNTADGALHHVADWGIDPETGTCLCFDKQQGPSWEVAQTGKTIILHDGPENDVRFCPCFSRKNFRTYIGSPVHSKTGISGVIEAFLMEDTSFDQEWLDYFETLAGQAAIALEAHRLLQNLEATNDQLREAYDATIEGWSKALELRDEETQGHSDRVMHLATELAERLDYNKADLADFRRGVLLHDIGKMGIPDNILLKPGPLTPEEWEIMKQHPLFAYELLQPIPYLRAALDIPRYHHERWNGSGYPEGRKGEDIPFSARIFAVVDVWDALISDRPYRRGWAEHEVVTYLQDNRAVLFDPQVVDAFLSMRETQQ